MIILHHPCLKVCESDSKSLKGYCVSDVEQTVNQTVLRLVESLQECTETWKGTTWLSISWPWRIKGIQLNRKRHHGNNLTSLALCQITCQDDSVLNYLNSKLQKGIKEIIPLKKSKCHLFIWKCFAKQIRWREFIYNHLRNALTEANEFLLAVGLIPHSEVFRCHCQTADDNRYRRMAAWEDGWESHKAK